MMDEMKELDEKRKGIEVEITDILNEFKENKQLLDDVEREDHIHNELYQEPEEKSSSSESNAEVASVKEEKPRTKASILVEKMVER